MAASQEYIEYILDLLLPLGHIETTRMFSGVLLKLDGVQLGVVLRGVLYFKITDTQMQDQCKKLGSEQFSYTRKDKVDPIVIKNWWSVPEEMVDDQERLVAFAQEILHTQ